MDTVATSKRALVVGLGIAGMSTALGLHRAGWTPIIVERSPARRTGGYFIALFPEGRQAATDLGIADHLHTRNPVGDAATWSVNRRGKRHRSLGFLDQPGGPAAVLRGDIEAALWQSISGARIEVRFATTPTEITDRVNDVRVHLTNAEAAVQYHEDFDLVVGADGMRSSVRRIVFGPHEEFLTNWEAMICAFQLPEQVPSFGPADSVVIAHAKRAMWVFGFADRAPTVLLTYRTKDVQEQFAGSPVDRLRTAFSGMDNAAVGHALNFLPQAPDYVFDSVHQVKLPRWSKGRVALVGDAAWCLNLYSGMGASIGLRAGAELGAALRQYPDDLAAALDSWETGLRPAITQHQRTARFKQQMFVPSSRAVEVLRPTLLRLLRRLRERRRSTALTAPSALSGSTP
ncbi:oxidoreductase [Mycobacterium sp. Root265]|uniref:FAD-dependent monooxygenase n=1 Tax=Mycobacterium sp. Root265 TaxID=1736504 RepID=UPI00070FD076|nr:FAD-dependent monooxygenase [Mycobacterium sp. Root265]KRD06029.1 oxidoreductase [Mycobacterium sp. Root265]